MTLALFLWYFVRIENLKLMFNYIVNTSYPLTNVEKHKIVASFPVNNKSTGSWITLIQPRWRSILSLFDFLMPVSVSNDLIFHSYCAPSFGVPMILCLFYSPFFRLNAYNQFVLKSILFVWSCSNRQK